jgi:hypothetical protein
LRILFAIVFFINILPLSAQQENKYPVEFGQFMNTTILYNPAAYEAHNHINFQAGILQYIGPYKSIKTYYSTLSYQLIKKYTHTFGANFFADHEGDLITRNNFYGRYAIQMTLNEKYSLASGTSIGFVNYAFNGSTPYSTGAATNIDASVGIWLHHKKYNVGYALNQLTNSVLKPIEESFILHPYSTFNADYIYRCHPNLNLKGYLVSRLYNKISNNVEAAILLEHYQTFNWGVGLKTQRGINFYIGINKIPIVEDNLHILFSYFIPTFENQANRYNFFEINLSYGINVKQAK